MGGSNQEDTMENSWKAGQRKKTRPHQGTPPRQQSLPLRPRSHGEHRMRTASRSGRRTTKGYQREKKKSRGDNDPNHPVHRIAARWRFCVSRMAAVGRLAVTGTVGQHQQRLSSVNAELTL